MVVVQRDRGDCFANHDEYRPVIDSRSDMERTPEQVAREDAPWLGAPLGRPQPDNERCPAFSRPVAIGVATEWMPIRWRPGDHRRDGAAGTGVPALA